MKSTWIKIVLMIAVSMHFIACGKKSSDEASVEAAPKTQGSPQAPAQSEPDQNDKDKKDEVKNDTSSTSKDEDDKKDIQQISTPGHEANNQDNGNKEDKKDVQKSKDEKSQNTASVRDGDKYSGSSDDYLRSFLKAKEAALSQSQRSLNVKAAQSIQSSSLKIDFGKTGDVALSLVVKSGSTTKAILLGGLMKSDRTSVLRSSKEKIMAQLKCMDMGNSCETALVTAKISGGDVSLIFRRTNMEVIADFGHKQCMSQACEDIFSVFRQTEDDIKDVKNITLAKLESVEIINGRSSFRGILRTAGNEAIVIGGDLLNEDVYPTMNLQADRTMKIEDMVDLAKMKNLKDNLHKSLSDVRIVGNDGQGTIRMLVNMKMLGNGTRDTFNLTFRRISLPISSLAVQLH